MGNLEKKISDELIYSQIDAVYYKILNKLKQFRQMEGVTKCSLTEQHDVSFKISDDNASKNEKK